jgi:hypothetical protein
MIWNEIHTKSPAKSASRGLFVYLFSSWLMNLARIDRARLDRMSVFHAWRNSRHKKAPDPKIEGFDETQLELGVI